MPTYEYRCATCGHDFETFQKFSDAALTVCPQCGGELHKVFNAVGIVFKGSGFYSTDNGSRKAAVSPSVPPSASTDSSSSATPDAPKADATASPKKPKKATNLKLKLHPITLAE